ncbi:MAG TPA: response regulator [Verrucomicrobiae bacterium]|nr:response regulator [Verrucomicrobiae bacterium]
MAADRKTILLIDDDPFFLRVLSDVFGNFGFRVHTAHDGIEGIRSYLDHRPQVVICDLIMPRLGGVSTCREIGRLAGAEDPVIILLTSMFKEPAHEHETPQLGAKVHIPKSTSAIDIVIMVEQLLERKLHAAAG